MAIGNWIERNWKPFPWFSAIGFSYAVSAVAWAHGRGYAATEACGYGVSNLGYVLLIATLPGKFRLFGIQTRKSAFLSGLGFVFLGVAIIWYYS